MSRNIFRYDAVVGYRFVPNLKGRVRHEGGGYLVRSNSAGFRDSKEFKKQRTPGKSRILVFGDSNTAGDGVSNGKRFSDLIEAQLDGVEVYNFGLPSSGTDQQYLAFREATQGMEYDLILLCPMVDNVRRNLQDARVIHSSLSGELACLPKPYFELEGDTLALRNSPVPKGHRPVEDTSEPMAEVSPLRSLARQVMTKADRNFPGLRSWSQRMRRIALPEEFNSADHPGWKLMAAILRKWTAEAQAPVVYCPIPMFDHIFGSIRSEPYRERFAELSAETGATLIDLMPALSSIPLEDRIPLRFPTDEHPTVEGHQVLANLIAQPLALILAEIAQSKVTSTAP